MHGLSQRLLFKNEETDFTAPSVLVTTAGKRVLKDKYKD